MTGSPSDSKQHKLIYTCLIRKGDLLEAALAIDRRQFTEPSDFVRTYDEARREMSRRRVPGEWEVRPVLPGEPPTTLPSWAEYRVDLDRKHPLPEDEDNA